MIEKLLKLPAPPGNLKMLLKKSREIVLYLLIGGITTVLNGAVYWVCIRYGAANVPATIAAWIIAVLFAFFANKLIVFGSSDLCWRKTLTEMCQFFGCRLGTGAIDVAIMYVTVDRWCWHGLLMKLISDFIVTLVNFFASKFFIFRKTEKSSGRPPENLRING